MATARATKAAYRLSARHSRPRHHPFRKSPSLQKGKEKHKKLRELQEQEEEVFKEGEEEGELEKLQEELQEQGGEREREGERVKRGKQRVV